MSDMTNKPESSAVALPAKARLFTALPSSLLLAVGLTLTVSAQAELALDESSVIKPIATAINCDLDFNDNQKKYQSLRQRTIACMRRQAESYQQPSMSARQRYLAYKVRAWLNYANHEESINSETTAANYALRDAETILQVLQNGTEDRFDLITDIPETSALMRPDLWANLNALKDSGGIDSAPRELAFSEVSLVWAAADHCEHGSRSSGSHFRMADRWLEQAREAFVNANDSAASVAMQELAVSYYQQYKALDPSDDVCRGQVLTSLVPTAISLSIADAAITNNIKIASAIPSTEPTVSYPVID